LKKIKLFDRRAAKVKPFILGHVFALHGNLLEMILTKSRDLALKACLLDLTHPTPAGVSEGTQQ
jgi:hypothetical protein